METSWLYVFARRLTLLVGLMGCAGWLMQGCALSEPDTQNVPESSLAETSPEHEVIVHLFEWKWTDVARECEAFLGPKGYAAVQVSPPTENAVVEGRPWWERYQPVSYTLDNRSGTRAEFADMVARCKAAGVDIYVDAILNHMTGVYAGIGTAGSTFSEYTYPGLYSYDDFHHCGLTENDDIWDFDDRQQVHTCELLNLADLDTGSDTVRDRLAAYLNDLINLGVAGFRIDAAKHMAPSDLAAILDRLDGDPYIYQEVVDTAPEPAWMPEYLATGAVTDFRYSAMVSDVFLNGSLARLHGDGSIWEDVTWLPADKALVFVDNHDNQRGHGAGGHIVTHKDGDLYTLAVVFMLAYPYGHPRVMSSYAFTDDAQGPPADAESRITSVHGDGEVDCFGETWQCEHRRPAIANMVAFRRATASAAAVSNWWSNGDNQIAFSRGDRGFVALNNDEQTLNATLQTGLAAGTYCNVIDGGLAEDTRTCTGSSVTVSPDGTAAISVEPGRALALHAAAKTNS
ncbi:MAG: alpha-amylase family protein [Rhodothermales bacterium]